MTAARTKAWTQIGSGVLLCATLFLSLLPPRSAIAQVSQPVELELVLAIDTSLSVDADEFALQTTGLALAFRDPQVISAIEAAGDNGIAVTLVQWGIGLQQTIAVDWTHVYDRDSAEVLARAIEASPRHIYGKGTSITRALWFSSNLFEGSGFHGRRRVIDISGDGRNNSGSPPAAMRDLVVASGIVVNGLAILDGDILLGAYYRENVTGGSASFVVVANDFEDYADAIKGKLQREILAPMAAQPIEGLPPT